MAIEFYVFLWVAALTMMWLVFGDDVTSRFFPTYAAKRRIKKKAKRLVSENKQRQRQARRSEHELAWALAHADKGPERQYLEERLAGLQVESASLTSSINHLQRMLESGYVSDEDRDDYTARLELACTRHEELSPKIDEIERKLGVDTLTRQQ